MPGVPAIWVQDSPWAIRVQIRSIAPCEYRTAS